jgi:hypothetical protein
MEWRRSIGWALGAALVLLIGWAVIGQREPRYQGRTLSEWMVKRQKSVTVAEMEEAERALRGIGERGVPWMMQWLRCDEPPWWKARLYALANGLPPGLARLKALGFVPEPWLRAESASVMLHALGPGATNALPELFRIIRDTSRTTQVRNRALWAIESLEGDALPYLLVALADSSSSNRVEIARMIGELRGDAGPAIPGLLRCLRETNAVLVAEATRVLGVFKLEPDLVVPELIRGLTNSYSRVRASSAEAMPGFGEAAKSAVPGLVLELRDVDLSARKAAWGALFTLAPHELEKEEGRTQRAEATRAVQ